MQRAGVVAHVRGPHGLDLQGAVRGHGDALAAGRRAVHLADELVAPGPRQPVRHRRVPGHAALQGGRVPEQDPRVGRWLRDLRPHQDGEVRRGGDGARLVGPDARVLPLVRAADGGHEEVAGVQDLPAAVSRLLLAAVEYPGCVGSGRTRRPAAERGVLAVEHGHVLRRRLQDGGGGLDAKPEADGVLSRLVGGEALEHARVLHLDLLHDQGAVHLHDVPGVWSAADRDGLRVPVPGDVGRRDAQRVAGQGDGGAELAEQVVARGLDERRLLLHHDAGRGRDGLGAARAQPHGARVHARVRHVGLEQRQRPVPGVVEAVQHAAVLHGDAVLEPQRLELVQRPRVGHAVQLDQRLPLEHVHVGGPHDKLGVHLLVRVPAHDQPDVGAVLLLAELRVGGARAVGALVLVVRGQDHEVALARDGVLVAVGGERPAVGLPGDGGRRVRLERRHGDHHRVARLHHQLLLLHVGEHAHVGYGHVDVVRDDGADGVLGHALVEPRVRPLHLQDAEVVLGREVVEVVPVLHPPVLRLWVCEGLTLQNLGPSLRDDGRGRLRDEPRRLQGL